MWCVCSEMLQLNPVATCNFLAVSQSCGRIPSWLLSYLEMRGSKEGKWPVSAVIQLLCPGEGSVTPCFAGGALGLGSVLPRSPQAICSQAFFAFSLSSFPPLIWITFD